MDGVDYLRGRILGLTALLGLAGILALVSCSLISPSEPPSQIWADGTYYNACCPPLILKHGLISTEGRVSPFSVENGKLNYRLNVPAGISVKEGHVLFGGTLVYVPFNDASGLHMEEYKAKTMHIYNRYDGTDFVFSKKMMPAADIKNLKADKNDRG